jgi:hypothetical protein
LSRLSFTLIALGLAALSAPALAGPLFFNFTGTVTQTNFDPSDPFGGSIVFGTPIMGTYVFDSATPDSDPSGSSGSYQHSGVPYGLSINIGGNVFSTNDFLAVNVLNGGGFDQYGVLACAGGAGACFSGDLTVSILMQDATGTALSSDALPGIAPSLAAFQSRTVAFNRNYFDDAGTFFQIQIDGTLDSLIAVPEPSTAVAVLLGCAFLAIARRKAKLKTE